MLPDIFGQCLLAEKPMSACAHFRPGSHKLLSWLDSAPPPPARHLLCSALNLTELGHPWMILHQVPQERVVSWGVRGSFHLSTLLNCAWAQQVAEHCSATTLPKSLPAAISASPQDAGNHCDVWTSAGVALSVPTPLRRHTANAGFKDSHSS